MVNTRQYRARPSPFSFFNRVGGARGRALGTWEDVSRR